MFSRAKRVGRYFLYFELFLKKKKPYAMFRERSTHIHADGLFTSKLNHKKCEIHTNDLRDGDDDC